MSGNCTPPESVNAGDDIFPVADIIPVFKNVKEERQWLLEQMAGAFRVFARKGYTLGTAGHISVRDPENPHTFWLNPLGYHFATLKASDMVLVNYDGDVIGGSRLPVNKAGFEIHGAIHKARPDVIAACHTHSIAGKAYSTFGKPLEMINQDVCVFFNNHTVYDSFGGIVLTEGEGKHIAAALGDNAGIILKNHGILTAGRNVAEAAILFIYLEHSCEAQLLADATGTKKQYIDDEKALYTCKATTTPEFLYAEFIPELRYEEHLDPSFKD